MKFNAVHLNSLFENATEGIVATNGEGNIILVNPSACKMFGYSVAELVGKKIELLIPSKLKKGHIKLREGFYHDPKNRVMGHGRDLHAERKDGSLFSVEVSLSTYIQGEERFVIAFIIDITKRKGIEENNIQQKQQLEKVTDEMRKLNSELEAKVEERTIILREALLRLEESQFELNEALGKERQLNEIKSRFVSLASHEFRTPLSTVLSSASLLGKYVTTEDQEKRTKHIDKIKTSVKHLNNLLEDFLSLGKLEDGKVGTHFSVFIVKDLVVDTIEEMKNVLKSGQQIRYEYKGVSVLESDKSLVKNILINLISNALKFSEKDSIIHVKSIINESHAIFKVQDEGIGISEEDKKHLFSSFFRGKNVVNIQGTGLGLHIVKRYLDLLGGSIDLQSVLGKGTTVIFTIPSKYS
ncbi:MAG TPA: PAS domain-containing sensor histidine kinase [Puia sp.]|jgi:PAS domain S-box-containing protein|nr:PAS domain-containing sensor histidine kinase [Puia sp.]